MGDNASQKVLIVDEDILRVLAAEVVLDAAGYNTAHLSTPAGFWAKLDYARPDVLLIDLSMSLFNSQEVLDQLKADAAYDDMAIVMYSDKNAEELQEFCVEQDLNGYFCKSQDITELPDFLSNFF